MKNLNIKIDEDKRHAYKMEAMISKVTLGEWVIAQLDKGLVDSKAQRQLAETEAGRIVEANYAMLAKQVAENPDAPLGSIPILNPTDAWNEMIAKAPKSQNLFNFTPISNESD